MFIFYVMFEQETQKNPGATHANISRVSHYYLAIICTKCKDTEIILFGKVGRITLMKQTNKTETYFVL